MKKRWWVFIVYVDDYISCSNTVRNPLNILHYRTGWNMLRMISSLSPMHENIMKVKDLKEEFKKNDRDWGYIRNFRNGTRINSGRFFGISLF